MGGSGQGSIPDNILVTVTATKGGADSNSYATVAEADAYINYIYGAAEWSSLAEDEKGRLLVSATRIIDKFNMVYGKLAATQKLCFPVDTKGDTDDNYVAIPDGFDRAKEACILQALYLFQNNDAIIEAYAQSVQGVKEEALSSVSKVVTGFNPFRKFSTDALKLLGKYIDLSFKIGRG